MDSPTGLNEPFLDSGGPHDVQQSAQGHPIADSTSLAASTRGEPAL